jgi:hypothetical protein
MAEYKVDMFNRDPNGLNDHVRVRFDEVLAEPDGAHSFICVWNCAYICFTGAKNCWYKFLTTICGIPLACCWGFEFACISFWHVWLVTPRMRAYMINCGCLQKFYGTCIQCMLQPICEACSYCFSNIRLTKVSG